MEWALPYHYQNRTSVGDYVWNGIHGQRRWDIWGMYPRVLG
jgi:hypothetical protein